MGGVGTHSQLPPTPIRVPGWMLILVTVRHGPSSLHRHQNTKWGGQESLFSDPCKAYVYPGHGVHIYNPDRMLYWGDLMS